MGFEPFDQNEVNRFHVGQQSRKVRLRAIAFMQQGPTARGGDEYLTRSRETMAVTVFARPIHVEALVSVLDRGHGQAGGAK
jgi:hypothetical protein